MAFRSAVSDEEVSLHKELTEKVIRCFFTVYNTLGFGFLEKVYENAMIHEMRINGLDAIAQKRINVHYKGQCVGEYFADIIVNETLILELKAAETLNKDHANQLINYLRATDIEVGLLLNFGKTPEMVRRSYLNTRKST